MSSLAYVGYIALFVLFYMLDELVIFGISVFAMRLWSASARTVLWATLFEALVLLAIGAHYAMRLI